jgi:hypothetical protein
MARSRGARSQLAIAFETTYGTAPPSGFIQAPFARFALASERPLLESELLGFGRDPLAPVPDVETTDGTITVPIDLRVWGHWLRATFGDAATTGASAPYTHVFSSGAWTLPSLSIERGLPDVPQFAMFSGARVNTLSWTMQRSGQLTAEIGLVAQGETTATTTAAGTPATTELVRFGQFNGSLTRGGSALANVESASITYSNNLDVIATLRSDGRIEDADPSMAMLTGSVVMRFADTTLLDQALAGDPAAFVFSFARSAGEAFTVTVPKVYLPRPRIAIDGPNGIQVTFDWQAAQDTGGAPMCTATLINDVEAYA